MGFPLRRCAVARKTLLKRSRLIFSRSGATAQWNSLKLEIRRDELDRLQHAVDFGAFINPRQVTNNHCGGHLPWTTRDLAIHLRVVRSDRNVVERRGSESQQSRRGLNDKHNSFRLTLDLDEPRLQLRLTRRGLSQYFA
jgi:hypothetical protein